MRERERDGFKSNPADGDTGSGKAEERRDDGRRTRARRRDDDGEQRFQEAVSSTSTEGEITDRGPTAGPAREEEEDLGRKGGAGRPRKREGGGWPTAQQRKKKERKEKEKEFPDLNIALYEF